MWPGRALSSDASGAGFAGGRAGNTPAPDRAPDNLCPRAPGRATRGRPDTRSLTFHQLLSEAWACPQALPFQSGTGKQRIEAA